MNIVGDSLPDSFSRSLLVSKDTKIYFLPYIPDYRSKGEIPQPVQKHTLERILTPLLHGINDVASNSVGSYVFLCH